MPFEIPEETKVKLQTTWNNLINLVKAGMTELRKEYRSTDAAIKKLDRLKLALRYRNDDVKFIMNYRDLLIEINPSFQGQFALIDEFIKRDNIDNDIVADTCKNITNNEGLVQDIETKRTKLTADKDALKAKLSDMANLIDGNYYPYEIISEYIKKGNFTQEEHNAILFYGFSKSIERREASEIARARNAEEKAQQAQEREEAEAREFNETLEAAITKYEEIEQKYAELTTKYYDQINNCGMAHKSALFAYADLSDEDFASFIGGIEEDTYDEVSAQVAAVKALKKQEEIKSYLEALKDGRDSDTLELLQIVIEEYDAGLQKLELLDHNIITKTPRPVDFSKAKVFYFFDEDGETYIDYETLSTQLGRIRTFEKKVENGSILEKQGTKVTQVKGLSDYEEVIGKTIFQQRTDNTTISYVKLNLENGREDNQGVFAGRRRI